MRFRCYNASVDSVMGAIVPVICVFAYANIVVVGLTEQQAALLSYFVHFACGIAA